MYAHVQAGIFATDISVFGTKDESAEFHQILHNDGRIIINSRNIVVHYVVIL